MEKTTIGYNAGAIWDKLRETGRITIAELARKLNMAADETAIAAGWLAREGKVYILKSATPFPKCYLHKEKWTFDS